MFTMIINPFSWFFNPMDTIARGFIGICGILDGLVYRLVSILFQLFFALARVQLLDNSVYRAIADRVYLFVGIIALFGVSVSLLKAIVNPSELNKSVINSFKSLITSLFLIILMPTIFEYAYSLQGAIIEDDIIGKIFQIDINEYKKDGESLIQTDSESMFEKCSFEDGEIKLVEVNDSSGRTVTASREITKKQCEANYITMTVLEAFVTPDSYKVKNNNDTTWSKARDYMIYTGNFNYIATFVDQMYDSKNGEGISYTFIISTLAGALLIYVVLSLCIDLGVRAAKLAFYQLISPIPVLMKIIPGKEGQFDKWSKATISTFLEVFVRLIVINFIIFMCGNLLAIIDSLSGFEEVGTIGKAILLLGLFVFAKQAPKLLGEALGFEGGNLKFGIKGKLTDVPVAGKAFAAGYGVANKFQGAATGALGAGYSSLINGGKFKDGAKFGAASGWKNGGKQFGSMRQETYRQMGYKGKAGWFGGQSWMDKRIDDNRDKFSDNFKDNVLRKWVQDFENNPDGIWQKSYRQKSNEMNDYYKNLLTKSRNDYSNLVSNRDNEIKKLNDKFASDFMEFQNANPNVEQSVLNAKVKEIEAKEQASIKAINEKYANQINTLQKNIHDSESLLSGGSATRLNSKGFQETFSIDSDSKKYAIGVARDAEPTYDNRKTIDEKRLNEKSVKEYTNSLEGQQAIAVQQQAMKNLQKDGPTPAKPDSGGNKK